MKSSFSLSAKKCQQIYLLYLDDRYQYEENVNKIELLYADWLFTKE